MSSVAISTAADRIPPSTRPLCNICDRLVAKFIELLPVPNKGRCKASFATRDNPNGPPSEIPKVPYHSSSSSFVSSVASGCPICTFLASQLDPDVYPATWKTDQTNELSFQDKPVWGGDVTVNEDTDKMVFQLNLKEQSLEDRIQENRMRILDYGDLITSESQAFLQLLQRWIQDCRSSHSGCERARDPSEIGWRPTRLIYCPPGEPIRLDTSSRQISAYMTLSHCWGKVENNMKLTSNRLFMWENEIPERELVKMKTFRDAIQIARACGIPYIWIDSMCIIQDNAMDWDFESKRMAQVYKFSYCNISASSAKDDAGGCFFERSGAPYANFRVPDKHKQARLGISESDLEFEIYKWSDEDEMLNAPAQGRGWIVQERIMSPRIIHFCRKQLFWECGAHMASERHPNGYDIRPSDRSRLAIFQDPNLPQSDGPYSPRNWLRTWLDIRRLYSATRVTMPKDALVAISAIAQETKKRVKCDYKAGIFIAKNGDVLCQLCWKPYPPRAKNDQVGEAPSWSWAVQMASSGELFYDHFDQYDWTVARYVDAEIHYAYDNPHDDPDNKIFGRVLKGSLSIEGTLILVQLSPNDASKCYVPDSGKPYDPEGEVIEIVWDIEATSLSIQSSTPGEYFFMPLLMLHSYYSSAVRGLLLKASENRARWSPKVEDGIKDEEREQKFTRVGFAEAWLGRLSESILFKKHVGTLNVDEDEYRYKPKAMPPPTLHTHLWKRIVIE